MKKYVLAFFVFLSHPSFAQEIIEMESSGSGTYSINCTVNGAPIKMIFDTGASNVSLSKTTVLYLFEQGLLKEGDIKGLSFSTIADGSQTPIQRVILKDVGIGSIHIKNVMASVNLAADAPPLLLGMSAIQSLGPVTIDGSRLIIHKTEYSEDDYRKMAYDAQQYIKGGNYTAAINNLLRIYNTIGLDKDLLYQLASCYHHQEQYDESLAECMQWLEYFGKDNELTKEFVQLYADNCFFLQQYMLAIDAYEILIECIPKTDNSYYWNCIQLAESYSKTNSHQKAIATMKAAISTYRQLSGIAISDIERGLIKDKHIGALFKVYGSMFLKANKNREGLYMIATAAKCGDDEAIEYCRKNRVKY